MVPGRLRGHIVSTLLASTSERVYIIYIISLVISLTSGRGAGANARSYVVRLDADRVQVLPHLREDRSLLGGIHRSNLAFTLSLAHAC